jgi:nucleotide-binding universal stress UspA family protein
MPIPQRILVPLDLSPPGEAKLVTAEAYARAFGAVLILLHVLPGKGPAATLGELRPSRRREAAAAAEAVAPEEAAALAYLDTIASRLHARGVTAQTLVRVGPIASTVLTVARDKDVGLIVIGSNVRPALPSVFLGNVAEAIVRGAPCPTLLVRPALTEIVPALAIRSFTADAERAGLLAPRTLGLRTVDVARIIGSVGRAGELDANFQLHPQSQATIHRYERVRAASAGETREVLPPIEVYKLGYGYYVLDGHRRVAAAKELGQTDIEAYVTEFVPIEDPLAQRLFTARRVFERTTGLKQIGAARPETYARLEETITRWAEKHYPDDYREAAERWYLKVFQPQMRRIRAARLRDHFPGERNADIFVRLADHRRAEGRRLGNKPPWDEALTSFVTFLHEATRT